MWREMLSFTFLKTAWFGLAMRTSIPTYVPGLPDHLNDNRFLGTMFRIQIWDPHLGPNPACKSMYLKIQ